MVHNVLDSGGCTSDNADIQAVVLGLGRGPGLLCCHYGDHAWSVQALSSVLIMVWSTLSCCIPCSQPDGHAPHPCVVAFKLGFTEQVCWAGLVNDKMARCGSLT